MKGMHSTDLLLLANRGTSHKVTHTGKLRQLISIPTVQSWVLRSFDLGCAGARPRHGP